MSEESPQQGDPSGSLLFSMTIEPLLTSLNSCLTLDYLDDLTMGDRQPTVAADVHRVEEIGENMGLTLNIGKCELFLLSKHIHCRSVAVIFQATQSERSFSSRCSTFHWA